MKKLAVGEQRFVTKKIDKLYRVYDRVWGSFPYQRKELGGKVVQDVPQDEAEAEAARLNKEFVTVPLVKKPKRTGKQESVEVEHFTPADELTEDDIPDYGIMSDEDRKKYEEGTVL